MSRTVRAALGPLVAALVRDDGEEALVELLRRALPAGPSPGAAGEHLVVADTGPDGVAIMASALPVWAGRGFVPLRVKPLRHGPVARQRLRVVLATLRRCDLHTLVPHWIAGDALVTLQQPAAVDLRDLSGHAPEVAGRARRSGLDLLDQFVAVERAVREATARHDAAPSLPFPVADRYTAALARMESLVGGDVTARLPAVIEDAPGPRVLFCDPKPANLVLAASEVDSWRETGSPAPVGVDLDLVHHDSSYVLQAVLATFSTPLPATDVAFAACRRQAHDACARQGVDPDAVDLILIYHLVRNLTTALERADLPKARAFAEALALADGALRLGLGDMRRDRLRDAARSPVGPRR
ncbi:MULTISPECIES: hypothetical protein [unclassified Micromonospora]|uniref:hypothetical protein n=1 Tax=unclassified Micromonospora TaxID=2617518 RepID=UPI00188EDB9A|nr:MULTISPECIES: hypothetical protein [unclassified Micromonospora]MBF5028538.1 hypothetical protein [Micromonospora sp. ANENR4]MCZ7472989.1 hypothetical protein [Micromonospora sp. WMMC273]WBC03670.1 hypothetical protein O7546_01450 [Micromonospora sp. WMMA1976]